MQREVCQRFEEREKDTEWFLLECGRSWSLCLSSAPDPETVKDLLDPGWAPRCVMSLTYNLTQRSWLAGASVSLASASQSCVPRPLPSKERACGEVLCGLWSPVFLDGWGPSCNRGPLNVEIPRRLEMSAGEGVCAATALLSEITPFPSMSNSFHLHPVPRKGQTKGAIIWVSACSPWGAPPALMSTVVIRQVLPGHLLGVLSLGFPRVTGSNLT